MLALENTSLDSDSDFGLAPEVVSVAGSTTAASSTSDFVFAAST